MFKYISVFEAKMKAKKNAAAPAPAAAPKAAPAPAAAPAPTAAPAEEENLTDDTELVSVITAGSGEGIVTATGMETEIGGIAKLIHETPEEITPLQKRLGDLGTMLSILAVGLCAVLFLMAIFQKRDAGEMFLTPDPSLQADKT